VNHDIVEASHRELLAVLVEHRVDFVLVGGVGLQLKGYSGATRDVDVTIAVGAANETRLRAALEQLRAVPYLAGDRGMAYRTNLGQLEIMRRTDGVGDYTQWALHAAGVDLGDGQQVLVGSASDLLAAKEAAGREKDLRVLPRIRAELLALGALAPADVRGPVAELAVEAPADPRAAELLGSRPNERVARGLWDHGAEIIGTYRARWQIPADSGDPLGDQPGAPDQQTDRGAIERQLQRTTRLLATAQAVDAEAAAAKRTSQACFPTRPGHPGSTTAPAGRNAGREPPSSSLER